MAPTPSIRQAERSRSTGPGESVQSTGESGTALPLLQFEGRPGILDLGWGHPNPSLLPVGPWLEASTAASSAFGWQALTYGHATGPGPLIDWLAAHLGGLEAEAVDTRTFFVTAGASHAISLLSTILCEPGDVVLVAAPTYHYALRILRDRGVDVLPVPSDEMGIDPSALAPLVAGLRRGGRGVPLLYLVPTFANPTGRCLPIERRAALVDVAARCGLAVVEDDTYREMCFEGQAPPSLWRVCGGDPVIRVGSFSKTVAPGLRLGWINASPHLVRRLAALGYVDSGGCVNHSVALSMASFGASGGYDRHVDRVRTEYRRQRDALVGALRTAAPQLPIHAPRGGWFLWLRLPEGQRCGDLLPVAERFGVSFVEGTAFHPHPDAGHEFLRASFSLLPPDQLAEAGRRLGLALSHRSGVSAPAEHVE